MMEYLTGEKHRFGRIEVVCGSMFSGKTEELIRRMKRAEFARQKVEIFKPSIDTRYSEIDVVGIDEAQFLDDGLIDVCNELANRGVRVIVAGLDMDFRGRPFGPMPSLCAIADEVTKVHAICVKCGALAYVSHRLVQNERRVLLGEQTEYEPLCRECYRKVLAEEVRTKVTDSLPINHEL